MTTTSDDRTIVRLRGAMADEVRGHHLDRDAALAVATTTPARQRPRRMLVAAVAGSVAAAAAVAVTYVAVNSGSHSTAPPAGASCAVETGVLPAWAREGFSDPQPVMPYVLGDRGDIIAILWSTSHPLNSPPLRQQNNKILWVSRLNGARLVIHASLGGTDSPVTRTVVGGPGPSIIDMPSPGCWTFDLSWGGHHDTMRLPYGNP